MAAGFAVVFGLVMVAEYAVFRRGLEALAALRHAGPPLTLYFLETLLVVVLVIALVSFVTTGLWTYYRARDTRLLLVSPLSTGGLYALRSAESFVLTSWALVVVGLPALLALGTAYERGIGFYLGGALTLGGFAALMGGLGALLTTGIALLLRRGPTPLTVGIAAIALVVGFALLVGKNVIPSTGDFFTIFEPGILNGKPASIKFIEARFALWPSHPFAIALYTGATGGAAGSPLTATALWLGPLAALGAAAPLGRRLYALTLPAIAESFGLSATRPARAASMARPFPRWPHGPVAALLERDLLALARNPHEWSRAAFLALLLALYTSFVFVAPLGEVTNRPPAVARLLFLNVVASGYFVTAFGLRFVFPSLSLEGRAAWVLFSSPVKLSRLLAAKLLLFAGLLTVTVVPISLAGTVRLVRDPLLLGTTAALLVLTGLTAVTLLLAAGAAWPDFKESNPEVLSTSGSGLVATALCLAYVAFVGEVARRAALAAMAGGAVAPWLGLAVVVSVCLGAGGLGLATRRLRALEVS